jgi:hypothetical protein
MQGYLKPHNRGLQKMMISRSLTGVIKEEFFAVIGLILHKEFCHTKINTT